MAEFFVGKPKFLGTEKQRNAATLELLAYALGPKFEAVERVMQGSMPHRSGADDEGTIRYRFGHAAKFSRAGQQVSCADGRPRFAKRWLKGAGHVKPAKAKIAHRARRSADIERVAWRDEHDLQIVELCEAGQGGV